MFQSENNTHSTKRHHHHQEDDEEECRVCRGPAEEGRPLFKPCKCSGSIGLTHQDCLTSWLEVKAGSGKCDLCQYTFQFAPQYAPDAPETLSVLEVLMELRLKLLYDWIPFAIRCVFVCLIWFGVMPLCTAYIYQGWMHRPSSVIGRMTWDLVGSDLVNGCLLTVINVVGFLSIMSLAEFLRLQWNKLGTITTEKEEEELNEDNVLIQEDILEDDYKKELQKSPKRAKDPNEIRRWWTRQRNRMEGGLPHGVAYRRHEAKEPLANTVSAKALPNYRAADTKYPFKRVGHKENNYRAADTKYPSKLDCFEEEQLPDSKDSLQRIDHEEKNNRYSHTKYPYKISLFEDDDDDDDDDEDYVDEESNNDDSDDDESDDESAIERMMQIQDEDDSGSDSDPDNAIQNDADLNGREDIRVIEANLLNIQQGLADENLPNERMVSLNRIFHDSMREGRNEN
jgi:E3 ubiquitin-protein ligase DOA10